MAAPFAVLAALLAVGVPLAGRPKVQGVPPVEERQSGIPVARVFATGPGLESWKGPRWTAMADGTLVKTGDRLRTGKAAARIELPWTKLVVSPGTLWSLAPSIVLTATIEEGRIEQRTIEGEDILKLRTPEALVRGTGHLIVRRHQGKTFISALEGSFDVATAPGTLHLTAGHGTVVQARERPSAPVRLPAMGREMFPGADPVYFRRNDTVKLTWEAPDGPHRVQVLAFDSEQVVHDVDVSGSEHTVALPLGLYRWRVSAVPTDAPDGRPSPDGFICIVED